MGPVRHGGPYIYVSVNHRPNVRNHADGFFSDGTIRVTMDESYRKCRTCRFCRHAGDMWVCLPESRPTDRDGTCGRYRPGCCENCSSYSGGVCGRTGEVMFELDVCSLYDPSGSV